MGTSRTTQNGYTPIVPKRKEWPVVYLSKHRKEFVDEVIRLSMTKVTEGAATVEALVDELEATLYKERLRIKENPWAVDPDDEEAFWRKVKRRLVTLSNHELDGPQLAEEGKKILYDITSRYAHEIASRFRPSRYRLARQIATFGFSRLLNASRVKGFQSFYSQRYALRDKIKIVGEIDQLRHLAQRGTIVMVPTHFSNLDSILIGWVIHELGLPPFIYGAGLNLFNINIFAYFMNSLGTYKVDRRKKNTVYLETLKSYSSLALQWGIHSLFFPGGGRSRSGGIESQLKLGLLGTAMEAQRVNYARSEQTGKPAEKIFVVPVVFNYHFVLEAPSLIREHLRREGQERYYVENDEYSNSYKIAKFLVKFFTQGSDISVSIGAAMDLLGNPVDQEGHSLDQRGNVISMREYFCTEGRISRDTQRESEYTRMLGQAILKAYYRVNQVFSSHLVAFAAFESIRQRYRHLDLYNLLRLPDEELVIPYAQFRELCDRLRAGVIQLKHAGKVDTAPHLHEDIDQVIEHGLRNVGLYHSQRPLLKNKDGDIVTMNLNTLYYYHNRLEGYELNRLVKPLTTSPLEIYE